MTTPSDQPYLPERDHADRVTVDNNRSPVAPRNMRTLYNTGRLAETEYLSILPVDQRVEYPAGVSSAANPLYSDPKNIMELATEAGCNYVASIYGMLASVSCRYMYHIPFPVKINHDEMFSYPNTLDQTLYASAEQTFSMDAVAVGATIYFGSEESYRQIEKISAAFERAHELGMVIVLWTYLCNFAFKKNGMDYHVSADPIEQVNYPITAIGTGIVKQKMAENNSRYKAVNFGYTNNHVYTKLISENPVNLVCYQLTNCYMGHAGLINSGGVAGGDTDLSDAVCTAVINKRAGDMGLILGRKAFKKTVANGAKLINTVQDAYPDSKVTIAWSFGSSLG